MRAYVLLWSGLAVICAGADGYAAQAMLTDFESPVALQRTGVGMEPGCGVARSDEQAHGGKYSTRIAYEFVTKEGRQYVALGTSLLMAGHVSAVSAWFLGDESGLPIVLRVTDTGGEVHQYRWGRLDFSGWRELTAELKSPLVIYGGDTNQTIDWPIRLTQLIVDHGPEPAEGVVYVDDITYSTDADARQLVSATVRGTQPGNVYVLNDLPPEFSVEVQNASADAEVEGTVSIRLVGPDGERLAEGRESCSLAPGGRAEYAGMTFDPRRAGLFRVEVALQDAGGTRELTSVPVCVLPDEGDTVLDPGSPFGACTHFAQGKGRLPDTMRLMARAGIKWLRDECSWAGVEREKGVYRFPEITEQYLSAAKDHGITPLIIFDYGNPLYDDGNGPTSDEAQAAFGEYCYQMVQRFKHLCKHWEVYNEPNIGFWKPKPDPEAYARLLKIAYAAAKRADPDCTVVGVCTAGTDLKFIRAVLEDTGSEPMDALSIHPYRYPRSPEASGFTDEVTRARDLLAEFGGRDQRLWLTEIGWPTHVGPRGLSEDASARMLVRMYVQAMSLPFVGPIIWYDFQNDGMNAEYNEHNFGLIRWDDFSAKAGYLAYRMMTRALAGKAFARRLDLDDRAAYAYVFAADDEKTIVAWYAPAEEAEGDDEPRHSVALRLDGNTAEVSAIAGQIETIALGDGTLPVTLTGSPVFIRGPFGEVKAAEAPLHLRLGETKGVRAGSEVNGSLEAHGLAGRPIELSGPWEIVPSTWRPQEANDRTPFRFRVPLGAAAGRYALNAHCTGQGPAAALGRSPSASVSVAVTSALEYAVTFEAAAERLHAWWVIRNRSPVDMVDVSAALRTLGGEPTDADSARLPKAGNLKAGIALPVEAFAPAAIQVIQADIRGQSAAGDELARAHTFTTSVWPVGPAAAPIAVDGGLSEWPELPIRLPVTLEAVALDQGAAHGRFALTGEHEWRGTGDCSAAVGLAYDDERLCVAVNVTDDVHAQPETGGDVWQGDNVQLAIDFRPSRELPGNGEQERRQTCEIGLTLGERGPEVFRWLPFGGPDGAEGDITKHVEFAAVREGPETRYEATIPWSSLLPPRGWEPAGPHASGRSPVLGFALIVNDNDGSGRKGWLQLYDGIGYGKDPDKYGLIILA